MRPGWIGEMERVGNGASRKRCDIDGVTRTGELAGVSEPNRDIDRQPERARERRQYVALESWRIDGKARRAQVSARVARNRFSFPTGNLRVLAFRSQFPAC